MKESVKFRSEGVGKVLNSRDVEGENNLRAGAARIFGSSLSVHWHLGLIFRVNVLRRCVIHILRDVRHRSTSNIFIVYKLPEVHTA